MRTEPDRPRPPARARRWRAASLVVLAAAGAVAGMLAAGRDRAVIGPFDGSLALRADISGDTVVRLPPLGTLRLDTHDGLLGLDVRAEELRPDAARRLFADPGQLVNLDQRAADDVRHAVRLVLARAAAGALAGALALALLREFSRRSVLIALLTWLVMVTAAAAASRATWNDRALAEPRFTGILAAAPNAIGAAERIQERYAAYRTQLARLIVNVSGLYRAASNLESFEPEDATIRLLHVSDLHLNPQGFDLITQVVREFKVDAVVDTGDIVDWGTELESRYTDAIGSLPVPYVFVRGNHDSAATAAAVAAEPNAIVLDGSGREVAGLKLWGIGDPRFTPDKSGGGTDEQQRQIRAFGAEVAERVDRRADVVLVHDPAVAGELEGLVRLVLAGHRHRPAERRLGPRGPLLLVEGSTGGAGLRTLEDGEPEALVCSVLYFDAETRRLAAYDRITVAGLGEAAVEIERHLVDQSQFVETVPTWRPPPRF